MTADRNRRLLWAALAALATALLTGCSDSGDGSPVSITSPSSASGFLGATYDPPRKLPDVTLTDTAGDAWNLASRGRDRVTVVYFGYTKCPDVCPTDMADLATAWRGLSPDEQKQVDIVFVTVDQRRDSRRVIRTWLDRFEPTMIGLTGMPNDLSRAARALGVPYRVNDTPQGLEEVEHGSQMTAFGPNGTSRLLWLDGTPPTDIGHDLSLLVAGQTPA